MTAPQKSLVFICFSTSFDLFVTEDNQMKYNFNIFRLRKGRAGEFLFHFSLLKDVGNAEKNISIICHKFFPSVGLNKGAMNSMILE